MTKYKLPKIEELLEAGAHFGHQVRRWNPKMEPYIYTVKKNIHIIDLEKTEELIKKACEFLYTTAAGGGQIIFVGTKKQAHDIVEIEAKRCGALFVTERWIGGTITNYRVIKKNMDKLINLTRQKETGDLEKYTKKERLLIDREIEKLQRNIGGILGLRGTPAALFIVDARREKTAVREAKRYNVPVVSVLDTNSDPRGIDYIIPGNDDAIKSIVIMLQAVSNAVEAGYKDFAKKAQENTASVESKTLENKVSTDSIELKDTQEPKSATTSVVSVEKPKKSKAKTTETKVVEPAKPRKIKKAVK